MFLTKPYKIRPFSKRQTSQKATGIAPGRAFVAVITFLQEVMCVLSGFNAFRLTPKLL